MMRMTDGDLLNGGDATDAERLAQLAIDFTTGRADLASVIGITDDELEALYVFGHRYYSCGKYEEARNFFRFLCLHRHIDARFWFGLAASSQMLGDPENAMHAYRLAGLLNGEDPQIPLRAAECFIKLDHPAAAITALENALALSVGRPEHKALAGRGLMMLNCLKSQVGSNHG
ncbi:MULTISPECIES: SycD/LcrH family type III secretion system chaperone [Bradyrhizobium]|uniref:SycD/LcrH family type III secretion system chaperone n=1 Tax=Bradyrhizobium TaxID=374 RepID=UPI000576BAB5|nr:MULTISPECIES: SycD/LcrH family type III secretion system chaperone [Bradyrhizobium]MBR1033934.1 SycD/LcrH family type III secretion system chaperone [Bradyrhizobium liaoningense]